MSSFFSSQHFFRSAFRALGPARDIRLKNVKRD